MSAAVEDLLTRWLEVYLERGERLDPAELAGGDPQLIDRLRAAIQRYEQLDAALRPDPQQDSDSRSAPPALPEIEGFRTIERIGTGGGGDVYKLEDLELGRVVAAKVLREDAALAATTLDFLREARALALFDDPGIVRLYELRADQQPPLLLMEYVDGFELGVIGPSLEYPQRAKIIAEVAETVHRAHAKGILHRDLKPGNVIVDRQLRPRVLDFGLSAAADTAVQAGGTPAYMAPEQLRPGARVDERSDVYALGVVLYQLLCGALPFRAESTTDLVEEILDAKPALPVEVDPATPEALQAIALKAMEREPESRYGSAREMAADLDRYLRGSPVLARPSLYSSSLARRVQGHLTQIGEWLRLKLVEPHEAERLRTAYARLEAADDEWIVHGRSLSWSQITLYLGAFLLVCGSLLFFTAYGLDAVRGVLRPLLTLGFPVAGLNLLAFVLFTRHRRAAAIAFFLAASALLPLTLLILLREAHLLQPASGESQIFTGGWISNAQLQVAMLVSWTWALWLALRTRTVTMATAWAALFGVFHLALLGDLGLRSWLEEGRWDLLGLWLIPLAAVLSGVGWAAEHRSLAWLARPAYFAAAGSMVLILELLALDGRAFALLGLSMAPFQPAELSDPLMLDTLTAMTLNGLLIYGVAWVIRRCGHALQQGPSAMLFIISPFAILEPMLVLNATAEYSIRFAWLYLAFAVAITLLSHVRQRKSFYFAGLSNTAVALWQITSRKEWLDEPAWATMIIVIGLLVLVAGASLDWREQRRPGS